MSHAPRLPTRTETTTPGATAAPRPTDAGRPLTARSIIASTLLGVDPPRLPSRALVRAGEVFGIAEGTTRVALSRMTAAGELVAEDGSYRLTGHLVDRQARQAEGRHPPLEAWDGRWECFVVRPDSRPAAARAELRQAMRALRMAEMRDGVWLRPANLGHDRQPEARKAVQDQCRRFVVIPDPPPGQEHAPAGMASQLWDLEGWTAEAQRLRAEMAEVGDELTVGDDRRPEAALLRRGWELAAAVLRHLVADPLLPPELLPEGWPGDALRADYDRYEKLFGKAWVAAIRD